MTRSLCLAFAVGFAPIAASTRAADPKPAAANIVFRNATIHDGSGKAGYKGDVHIQGGRIVAVGKVGQVAGAKEVEARGLVICPGFIDLHTHCDLGNPRITAKRGRPNKNYVMQGVTTVVTGNCGSGPVDAAKYFQDLESGGIGTNVIHQAPHNSIRARVMGNVNRAPTAEELARMEALVAKAMDDGAVGLATGLIYNPGTYARMDEIAALAKMSGKRGGLYASHIRNEGVRLLDAIDEAIRIGRESGCRVHISHIKASGRSAWGTSSRAVALIEAARKKGEKVTADQYPYMASSTSLRAIVVPSKYRAGSQKDFLARLDDPKIGPRIKKDIASSLGTGKTIQIAGYSKKPQWQGKRIAAIAESEKKEPLEIVLEIERNGGAGVVSFSMKEDDVRVYMKQPWVATASDGSTHLPGATVPHPRSYGTFPRKIGHYAIEEKFLSLERAIRSASGLPADILQLKDRGYLKPGYRADLVVFDPASFRDKATFEKPHQYAVGARWVIVNGVAEVAEGKFQNGALGGQVIRFNQEKK